MVRDPYCGNCGYSLRGLTESSKRPECGKLIVEGLQHDRHLPQGKRYKSKTALFGLPLIHVALGPHEQDSYGRARSITGIGDIASGRLVVGVPAVGGPAIGRLALGGGALGSAVMG